MGGEEEKEMEEALERATIASGGQLREGFRWLGEEGGPLSTWRAENAKKERMGKGGERDRRKRVLVLGSGMVAGPAVGEIAGRGDVDVVVGV